jgi:hypothetical protein
VDLHRSIFGAKADPAEQRRAVESCAGQMTVAGADVTVPSKPARALIVALHAAHHGVDQAKPLRDLSRAIERADFALWDGAARLGEREEAFRDEAEERVRGPDRPGARGRPRASGWYDHRETDDQENGTNIDVIQMDEPGRAS